MTDTISGDPSTQNPFKNRQNGFDLGSGEQKPLARRGGIVIYTGMKKALITGITGQDGSYLAELLLKKGYEVHGIIRRSSSFNTERIEHLYQDPHEADAELKLHYGDLSDGSSLNRILEKTKPDEI